MKELLQGVLATLTPEKELLVVNEQEAGWPPELVLMLWRREKLPHPCQEPKPNSSVTQHTTFSMELPCLPGDRGCSTQLTAVFKLGVTSFGNREY
jgi:hypothetical protein